MRLLNGDWQVDSAHPVGACTLRARGALRSAGSTLRSGYLRAATTSGAAENSNGLAHRAVKPCDPGNRTNRERAGPVFPPQPAQGGDSPWPSRRETSVTRETLAQCFGPCDPKARLPPVVLRLTGAPVGASRPWCPPRDQVQRPPQNLRRNQRRPPTEDRSPPPAKHRARDRSNEMRNLKA
jgi:hypothetical protein